MHGRLISSKTQFEYTLDFLASIKYDILSEPKFLGCIDNQILWPLLHHCERESCTITNSSFLFMKQGLPTYTSVTIYNKHDLACWLSLPLGFFGLQIIIVLDSHFFPHISNRSVLPCRWKIFLRFGNGQRKFWYPDYTMLTGTMVKHSSTRKGFSVIGQRS